MLAIQLNKMACQHWLNRSEPFLEAFLNAFHLMHVIWDRRLWELKEIKQCKNERVNELSNMVHHKYASCNVNFCMHLIDAHVSHLNHLNSIYLNHSNCLLSIIFVVKIGNFAFHFIFVMQISMEMTSITNL